MRVGIDAATLSGRDLGPREMLALACEYELEGLQLPDVRVVDRELNGERLEQFAADVLARRMYLEVGIPSVNPVRWSKHLGYDVRPEDHAFALRPLIEAASRLGCKFVHTHVGDRHDRFRIDMRWPDQQVATLTVLRHLTPLLKSLKMKAAIENHADLTAAELERFVQVMGSDVAGVCLDPAYLVLRLDEPLAATERLAPHVLCTRVQDGVLAFNARGLCWQGRPVGAGIMPMADILGVLHRYNTALNLSISLHPGVWDLPIYDPSWLGGFPELKPESLAAVVRLAALCEKRYEEGLFERPAEATPQVFLERSIEAIGQSSGYLKPMVALMGRLMSRTAPNR